MRKMGTVPTQILAKRFAGFAQKNGLAISFDPDEPENVTIWAVPEEEVAKYRELLLKFLENPDHPAFLNLESTYKEKPQPTLPKRPPRQWQGGAGIAGLPVTVTFIAISVIIYFVGLNDPKHQLAQLLYFSTDPRDFYFPKNFALLDYTL